MKNMECKISRYVILYNILMSSLFTLEEEPEVLHEKHILSSIDVTKNKSSKKVIRRIKKKQKIRPQSKAKISRMQFLSLLTEIFQVN